MDIKKFSNRLFQDLKKHFSDVVIEGSVVKVRQGASEVNLQINTLFRDYQYSKDYPSVLGGYKNIVKKALEEHKFHVNYSNIYPIIKNRDFGKSEEISFYRESLALDLDLLYVTDCGDTFRFILYSDQVDFNNLQYHSFKNLDKITNALVRLDDSLEVYTLKFTTDYAAALLLSKTIQKQIAKKMGTDYLFAIPSTSTLLVSKYSPLYIDILKRLMAVDNDPNKISSRVYRVKDGAYSFAEKKHLVSVKKV